MNQDQSIIPHGIYCYGVSGLCPYWDSDLSKGPQNYGYCHYLMAGDWESDDFSLLWDQVKECGVNTEWEDDEY